MARKRGIDVLLNKESKRETPAVVNFSDKMRFLGTDGSAKMGMAPANTVHQLKRLLGRKFKDPSVQADIAKMPFSVTEGPDGGCLINVQFLNEPHTFTPQQLVAMVLVDLKKIAEAESGVPPVDCVLSVPIYYGEAERYAMLNAAQIAGLNCLRLINENTATALAYGIFKTDLPENEPVHVAFVDVGHTSTQVSVVSLKKTGLTVRSHAWDSNLGGRDLDELLFQHFCAEFKAKNKIDIAANKKASFKLRTALEKVKKILSANAEAALNVECIMEDSDVRGVMTRDKFEELALPMMPRFKAVLEQALAQSGVPVTDISSVEVVGSSTRVPMLAKIVEEVFQKAPSRTLNAKECVSRGAALQCAMLSPAFKVREFEVQDACPFTVEFRWEKEGGEGPASQRLFERGSVFPSAKMLTFLRSQPFSISAHVAETGEAIGSYAVGPFAPPASGEKAKLKVKVRMNLHGLVSVESVQAIEEEEVEDAKMEDAAGAAPSPAPDANGEAAGPAPMETDAAGPKPEATAAPAEKKKRVKKHDVPFQPSGVAGYSQKSLDDYFEAEGKMQATDRLQEETNERKNAVEAYVYALRNKLYGELEAYVKPEEKDSLLAALQACEDWLYEEGEDCTKSVYVAKLEELKVLGGPVETRFAEDQARPAAVDALKQTAESYLAFARHDVPSTAHIPAEDKAAVGKEAEAALAWVNEKVAIQKGLPKHAPPELLVADINKKREALDRFARPITTRPVPKPAAPPAKDAAPEPPASEGAAPMESEGGEGASPSPEPTPAAAEEAVAMDV